MSEAVLTTLGDVHREPEVQRALLRVAAEDAATLEDQCAATEIAAPLHGETHRAVWLEVRLRASGTEAPGRDDAGNVQALLPGVPALPPIVLAAHLDTVFDADVDVRVRREDGRLRAPGISDNSRGLAALVRAAAVLAPLSRRHPLLFVGTVGEEGAGDLRGVKHLFHDRGLRPAAFLAVDGAGMRRIVHRAIGSRRLRIRIDGPGGHSWTNRDRPNPVHALGTVITGLEALRRASGRSVGISVGRVGGGTSINAIPARAWLELDLRAESTPLIAELESRARRLVRDAVAAHPPLAADVEVMGDRPAGALSAEHVLVRAATEATRRLGVEPELVASSTDANVPLSLGLPALALGAGGDAGDTHTLAEWYRNDGGAAGIQRLVLTVLALDRLL